jgi:hypothetical protein
MEVCFQGAHTSTPRKSLTNHELATILVRGTAIDIAVAARAGNG